MNEKQDRGSNPGFEVQSLACYRCTILLVVLNARDPATCLR